MGKWLVLRQRFLIFFEWFNHKLSLIKNIIKILKIFYKNYK